MLEKYKGHFTNSHQCVLCEPVAVRQHAFRHAHGSTTIVWPPSVVINRLDQDQGPVDPITA